MADHDTPEVHSVGELLDRLDRTAREHEDKTSLGDVFDMIGRRSFGPLLLFAGLVMLAPGVGDIPGVPVLMGLVVIITSVQLVMKRDHIWLPGWLLRRSVKGRRIHTGVRWLRPVARVLDRWSTHRWEPLTHGASALVGGVGLIVIGAATPLMEVVPFSANVAGIAVTAFGLALISGDGLFALVSIAASIGTFVLVLWQFV